MKYIQYKAVYAGSEERIFEVRARDIDTGFRKAVALALANPKPAGIHSVEFWMVRIP